MPLSSTTRKARARNIALIIVLSIAAAGLLYRMLRPYFEEPTPAPRADESAGDVTEPVKLMRVIDGDTIEVRWRDRTERVRLLRINTPERGRRGYDEATAALRRALRGAELTLEFEQRGRPERDKYDRLLAYVWAGDTNANVKMVRLGWTKFWTRYGAGRHAESFIAAENEARHAQSGLWGDSGWNLD